MTKPTLYPTFKLLVTKYRKEEFKTRRKLVEKLTYECNYDLSYEAVTNYENGTREPDTTYVVLLKKVLKLTEDEFKSLADAIIVDYSDHLFESYKATTDKLISSGSPCAPEP